MKFVLTFLTMLTIMLAGVTAVAPSYAYAERQPTPSEDGGTGKVPKSPTVTSNCDVTSNDVCFNSLPRVAGDGSSTVQKILTIVIGVIAAVSVLFVIIGGMRYIFSQGDPQGVVKAKSTIIYALIGLAVAILAQGIVIFVVNRLTR